MTTLSPTRVRGKVSDEWPSRPMDSRRKSSPHTATASGNNWPREVHPNPSRYTKPNVYQQDCPGEPHSKFPEAKSSEETVVEEEEGNRNTLHNYPDETIYVNVVPKHNNPTIREKVQRPNGHSEFNMPEAVIAMQKLQKLKELQMKRDISERYYSQEIKRLIGEYYLGAKIGTSPLKTAGKLQSTSFQPYSENRSKIVPKVLQERNLEPCGTMTTITRLNCGCVQETTRPIFTTPRGRVQRKDCSQSQDEVLLKLTSANPQERFFSSLEESHKDRYRVKPKKRMDPRIYMKVPLVGDQEFEAEHEKRNEPEEPETIDRMSRPASPRRKFSDTSATSA
ncbi:uncharacterized protein LOC117600181 isoform X2 [Osmia lignaria lignaria]|uniref:uncharacterized protein LOC117600181 isoform X2 n=1 Tax=Osmia lignaria lignaria TaxID=1437193 RepID=UPI0014791DB9|nr:uncharacterized protein LOC117600181 isoform X2 [Osmia lignaria]